MSSLFSIINSQNRCIHFLFTVIVSSQKEISFAPYFSTTCFISLTDFSGLLILIILPNTALAEQKLQLKAQPRVTIIFTTGFLLYWLGNGMYLSIGSKSLAGKGSSSTSLTGSLMLFNIISFPFLKQSPLMPSQLLKNLFMFHPVFLYSLRSSSAVNSPSPLTRTSKQGFSFSTSSGSIVACCPPITVRVSGSAFFTSLAAATALWKLEVNEEKPTVFGLISEILSTNSPTL